ncbi:MAG: nucleoside kinase, partial [Rikenellaceae bacterium]
EIKRFMNGIIADDPPIKHNTLFWEQALELFRAEGLKEKLTLVESRKRLYYSVDILNEHCGYFYGTIADRTGVLKDFDISPFMTGYILIPPTTSDGRPRYSIDATKIKMYDTFMKFKAWQNLIGITSIGVLNEAVDGGGADEIVKICEALQEKNLSNLADEVTGFCYKGVKLILISGPSSSGKTTFSKKLNIQLRIFGLKPLVVSMDDYFVERDHTPLDEYGNKDYETIEAVDIELFQDNILKLLKGEEVSVPTYNFIKGKREYNGETLKMGDKSVIIVEGIHALNPLLTSRIDENATYKIYVSALASMSMDYTTYISTTDNRLLRRIVRDAKYRNRKCEETLGWWAGVRRGEEKHIFPYQNEADRLFNSALPYEICVLKCLAEPLLLNVPNTMVEYAEASRLLNMLSFISPIDINLVPPSSLLREFVGGSNY